MEPYQQLEHDWAAFNGLDPVGIVACSSGTAALHLALEALRLPPGSEVITGDYNMIAVARAIALAGLVPVFVDCGPDLLVDVELVKKYQNGVGAVVYTHVYGRRCDMKDYGRTHGPEDQPHAVRAGEHYIIEDLAEAHGVRPHRLTDAACWSFYHNKIVAGEEGGAVWFRNPEHAARARRLRSLGFTEAHDYVHEPRGHNYRMSNAHAKLIQDSLWRVNRQHEWLDPISGGIVFEPWTPLSRRRDIEGWYDAACPAKWRMPARDAVWVYDVRLPDVFTTDNRAAREEMMVIVRRLQEAGIAARPGFWPMHLQEEFKGCRYVWADACRSIQAARTVMYLPVQPGRTTEADCRRAFQILTEAIPPAP